MGLKKDISKVREKGLFRYFRPYDFWHFNNEETWHDACPTCFFDHAVWKKFVIVICNEWQHVVDAFLKLHPFFQFSFSFIFAFSIQFRMFLVLIPFFDLLIAISSSRFFSHVFDSLVWIEFFLSVFLSLCFHLSVSLCFHLSICFYLIISFSSTTTRARIRTNVHLSKKMNFLISFIDCLFFLIIAIVTFLIIFFFHHHFLIIIFFSHLSRTY